MTLADKRKVVYAKIETTAGTAISIADADSAFYGYDAVYTPNPTFTDAPASGTTAMYPSQLGIETGTITFKTDLYQGAPWGPILLPACGFVDNVGNLSGTAWSPTDDITKWRWLTIGFNKAGKKYGLRGAMGTAVINLNPGSVPTVDWTFTGAVIAEADATQLIPAFAVADDITAPRYVGATTTLNSVATCWGAGTLDIGNAVNPLLCQNSAGGIEKSWIESRRTILNIDPLETLAATRDDYGLLQAGTTHAFSTAWSNMSITMSHAQRIAAGFGTRNELSTRQLQLLATIEEDEDLTDSLTIDLDTTD